MTVLLIVLVGESPSGVTELPEATRKGANLIREFKQKRNFVFQSLRIQSLEYSITLLVISLPEAFGMIFVVGMNSATNSPATPTKLHAAYSNE